MKSRVVRGKGHLLGLRRAASAEHHRRHTLSPHGDRADVGRQHIFAGRRLLLNVNAAGGGSLVVKVHRAGAAPGAPALLTSVPLTRNGVDVEALWGGTPTRAGNATAVGHLSGQPVRLVIRMRDCELYSFRFAQ